jgi:hypothetical protein
MSRWKLWTLVALAALIAAAACLYTVLPKQYEVGEQLLQTTIFWNDQEAFVFLKTGTNGRVENALLKKLRSARSFYWAILLGGGHQFFDQDARAFHLSASGEWEDLPLPGRPTLDGDWTLVNGNLQLTPRVDFDHRSGFAWDGQKFVVIAAPLPPKKPNAGTTLAPDDDSEEDDGSYGFLNSAARKAFKEQGWHYKVVQPYDLQASQATLPIAFQDHSFALTVTYFPKAAPRAEFDFMAYGIKRLELASSSNPQAIRTIWNQAGWQTVSKAEFDRLAARSGRNFEMPYSIWIWLAALLFLVFWKFTGWFFLASQLFGAKRRVLNNMATVYSFPPAMPSQFSQLDTAELERYTREFEQLGFVRLADLSLVANTPKPIPNFCRLFVHTRNHCFAEVSQIFPPRKRPLPLRCSIQSTLTEGWTLAFANRKPQAAGAMLRRKMALSVSMPEASTYEVLQAFLQMRRQVCDDLGISVSNGDTLDAYYAKVQRAAMEMREAVSQRSFATILPHFYYRKFALLKTKPEYVWLGDYPKLAEQRKRGFPTAEPIAR